MTANTPDFLGSPEIPKKTYFSTPPPEPAKTAPSRWCRGAGCEGAAYVARRKRANTRKLSDLDAPGGPAGGSSPENFHVSRRSRRLRHRTRAPLMYSTAAPGVDFGVFSLFWRSTPRKLDILVIQLRRRSCFRHCQTLKKTREAPRCKNFLQIHFAQTLQ